MAASKKDTKFKPGASGNPVGRPMGTKNKMGVAIQDMVRDALELAGEDARKKLRTAHGIQVRRDAKHNPGLNYLRLQAMENPAVFMSLVKQLMPKTIDLDIQMSTTTLMTEVAARRAALPKMRAALLAGHDLIEAEIIGDSDDSEST